MSGSLPPRASHSTLPTWCAGGCEHHLGDSSLAAPLFQGLDGSLVTGQALDIENLALGRIGRRIHAPLWTHIRPNETGNLAARLAENPEAIGRLLHDLAVSGWRPGGEFREQQRRRRSVERKVRRLLLNAGAGAAGVRALFRDLRLAQTFLPLRETVKHCYTGAIPGVEANPLGDKRASRVE